MALESRRLLPREQAGFRDGEEECPGQAVALLKVIQRRAFEGKCTFLLFIDLTKAYDTVPQEVLFAKFHQIGIRGHAGFHSGLICHFSIPASLSLGEVIECHSAGTRPSPGLPSLMPF